ncbi:MAG TPA: DUF2294 domain-containing protein [Thermoleophilaceae bacterium]|jgi:uncharacterized protein YbcI|nr:DUF2294 domain-containing protein [Thermoleophilaceae bacterium]
MTGTASRGQLAAAISNAVVGIHSKHYGKGPTKAKTYLIDDTIVCVLQDVFTTVERTLIEAGKGDLVREVRTTFQYALRDEFIDAVAAIVGRTPRAFMSQIDCGADIAIEFFLLEDGVPDVTQGNGGAPD